MVLFLIFFLLVNFDILVLSGVFLDVKFELVLL